MCQIIAFEQTNLMIFGFEATEYNVFGCSINFQTVLMSQSKDMATYKCGQYSHQGPIAWLSNDTLYA
jgi:hypothetical protein